MTKGRQALLESGSGDLKTSVWTQVPHNVWTRRGVRAPKESRHWLEFPSSLLAIADEVIE